MTKPQNRIVEGLIILEAYDPLNISAEHDIICAGPDDIEKVSYDDRRRLDELGWFVEVGSNSYAHFT